MRYLIFVMTWITAGFVYAWLVGGAARLGGPDERR